MKNDINKRCIYVYIFSDNHVYIGLTYNLKIRKLTHKNEKSQVCKYIKISGLIPEIKQLTDYIDYRDAKKLEEEYINYYKSKKYEVLNKAKAGALGGNTIKWTKENCCQEALKYASKKDFIKNSTTAYNTSCRKGWLNEICSHMTQKITKEQCIEESQKYSYIRDFFKNSKSAYYYAKNNNIFDEICSHMKRLVNVRGYWTKENCIKESLKYKSIVDFRNNSKVSYNIAMKNKWLQEICNHMIDIKNNNENMKTVNIDDKIHENLRIFCKENDIKINELLNNIIEDFLLAKHKSILPLILRNGKEVYEIITCNSISPETKNNMPKELSLLRNTNDGTGFIANYKQV